MKKLASIFLVMALAACQPDKIGFVDSVKLLDGYTEKIEWETGYKRKADALNKKSDSISKAFQLEFQELQSRAQRMSQNKAQEELGMLQQRSQFVGQQLRQEEQAIQMDGQVKMDSLVKKVREEVKAFGKANGYTYILTGGEGGGVLYGDETKDVTEQIVKILNEKYKK